MYIYTVPKKDGSLIIHGNVINEETLDVVIKKLNEIDGHTWMIMGEADNPDSPLRVCGIQYDLKARPIEIKTRDYTGRFVNEERFILPFYTMRPFTKEQVGPRDLVLVAPEFTHSKSHGTSVWTFINESTQKSYVSKTFYDNYKREDGAYEGDFGKELFSDIGSVAQFFLPNDELEFEKGYYSVELRYKHGDEVQTVKLNSAFYI